MVSRPEEYHWPSHLDYLGERQSPDWLKTAFILDYFGKGKNACKKYRIFVEDLMRREYESPLNGIGTTTYTYDAANRLTSSTDPRNFAISYTRDANGNITKITYPGNKTVSYTFDALNRIKTVTIDWLGKTATYNYDDTGRMTDLTQFNNTIAHYTYDNANRLTALENRLSNPGSVIATYSYTLDANGNRTAINQIVPVSINITPANRDFTMNLQKNRLQQAGATSFTYDNEGQLATKTGETYTFDDAHRVVSITGSVNHQYKYDGAGNRLEATRNGVITRYIYDANGNLLAEADGMNTIQKYYIYGNGLLSMVTSVGSLYSYHFDGTGHTVALTDASANVVNKYAYTPFGTIGNQEDIISQPFKYVAKYGVMTEPNGLYYMKARYYDSNVNRFISEDPKGFDGGDVNLMAYVANSPVMRTDPTGLFWFRQDWQTDYVVGREGSKLVSPGDAISRFIENYVPAGRTFGDLHDAFVDAAHSVGIPDAVANIPSMIPMYAVALGTEVLRTLGILNQPTPAAQPTTTRQPAPCK